MRSIEKHGAPRHWADVPGPLVPPEFVDKSPQIDAESGQTLVSTSANSQEIGLAEESDLSAAMTPPDTPRSQIGTRTPPLGAPELALASTSAGNGQALPTETAEEACSILHLAVQYPSGGPLRSILRAQADVHARDSHGVTALHIAALCGRADATSTLLLARASVDIAAEDGSKPLHVASRSGCTEVLDLLLDAKADIESEDMSGSRALHIACDAGHLEVVEVLLAADASCKIQDSWQRTPLHRAAFAGSKDLVDTLLLHGADAAQKDAFAQTPIDIAIQSNNGPIVMNLWKSCPGSANDVSFST